MYALVEKGDAIFPKENYQTFCDIDAIAVSMSQKLLRSFSRKARFSFLARMYLSVYINVIAALYISRNS